MQTIDLRSTTGSTPDAVRPAGGPLQWILVVCALCACAGIVTEVAVSLSATEIPMERLSYHGGDVDSDPGWRTSGVREELTPILSGDRIVAIGGVPAIDLLRSDEARRGVDAALKEGPVTVRIDREPAIRRRDFTRWQILGASGGSHGRTSYRVVLDSTDAGRGLEETLRRFDASDPDVCGAPTPPCGPDRRIVGRIPPGLDLSAAERALVDYDPALRVLPVGTVVHLGLRGDDLAIRMVLLKTPGGIWLQLDGTGDGWAVVPGGMSEQTLSLVRRRWSESAVAVSARLVLLMIAVVGLLSFRARSAAEAIGHFVAVCSLSAIGAVPALLQSWTRLREPISGELLYGDVYFRHRTITGSWTMSSAGTFVETLGLVSLAALVLGLVGHLVIRLLHTFPSREPELEVRYGFPWRAIAVMAFLGLVVSVAAGGLELGGDALWALRIGAFGGVTVLLSTVVLLVQTTRLALARVRQPRRGEEALQARLALSGLALGSLLLLVIWTFPAWYRASVPWTVGLYDAVQGARFALAPVAFAIPFLGFFLAIAKRGLWDVDLIIQRATVYSSLTALFVVAWVLLEASVETFLSENLAALPVFGDLAPALLAGGLVAVSQRSVTGFLSRRFRPEGVPLAEVVADVAEELDVVDEDALPDRLVAHLKRLAEPSHCALFLRPEGGSSWRRWTTEAHGPASVVVAATLDHLGRSRHVVATVDEGPLLVTKVDRVGEPSGILVMGMRPGASFYSAADRQLLGLFLGTLRPRLLA